jgi:hypothetical protein
MSTNRIALALSVIALILSLGPCIFVDRVAYPGVSHIRLRDADSGKPIGFVHAGYGIVTIASEGEQGSGLTQLILQDGKATIELWKGGKRVGVWSLSEDGEKFEKLTDSPAP